jgi:hypothetical protein
MKHKHALMLPLIFFCIFAICLPVYADDTTISGCYKKMNGQLRIVGKGSKCLPSESSISWNQAGPPGPAGPSSTGASIPVRQIKAAPCTGDYGWCPDDFSKWVFHILDSAVNESSVVAINIVNPDRWDYGCEVAAKGAGEFQIMCIGDDSVKSGAILQYAVFNP